MAVDVVRSFDVYNQSLHATGENGLTNTGAAGPSWGQWPVGPLDYHYKGYLAQYNTSLGGHAIGGGVDASSGEQCWVTGMRDYVPAAPANAGRVLYEANDPDVRITSSATTVLVDCDINNPTSQHWVDSTTLHLSSIGIYIKGVTGRPDGRNRSWRPNGAPGYTLNLGGFANNQYHTDDVTNPIILRLTATQFNYSTGSLLSGHSPDIECDTYLDDMSSITYTTGAWHRVRLSLQQLSDRDRLEAYLWDTSSETWRKIGEREVLATDNHYFTPGPDATVGVYVDRIAAFNGGATRITGWLGFDNFRVTIF